MSAPTGQQKNKNGTPCISKRFRYKRKIFKKSFALPKGFPKAAIYPRLSLVQIQILMVVWVVFRLKILIVIIVAMGTYL